MSRSISTKDAAKLLRAALKRKYPGVKFSVRFEQYSMGSHINLAWTDGPVKSEVEAFSAAFSSSRFDGYDDSTSYVYSWLLPNGEALAAERKTPGEPPVAGAELVSFHGSLPHCSRTISPDYEAVCAKVWTKLTVRERSTLQIQPRFPAWEGASDGYKLACFFDADQIINSRGASQCAA